MANQKQISALPSIVAFSENDNPLLNQLNGEKKAGFQLQISQNTSKVLTSYVSCHPEAWETLIHD